MGDLYLHLGFARRARFTDGLHPIAVEALVRAPGAVILGATLPSLPEVEHKGASFFRRLFMPGKQKRAFWSKALEPAGSPSLELALAVMEKGKGPKPGGMARFALGLGVLSHQVLHARVADLTSSLEGAQRDAMNRALARVWLADALPNKDVLAAELTPTLALDDNSHAYKALVEHLNGALREAHGDAPGTETLWRWLRGLCAEVGPLAERATLPPSLSVTDEDARAKHGGALTAAVEDARRWFALLVNQLSPLFTGGDPAREEMRRALVDESDALLRPAGDEATPSAGRFHDEVAALRREHLFRGRNPKPAYDEVSGASERAAPAGMPPVPDDASGPMLRVPAHTQEISATDIEAELAPPPSFAAPAHTQEVSVAQIEEQLGGLSVPAPSASGATPPPAPTSTQQVSLDDIQEELASQPAAPAAPAASGATPPPAPTSTQQVSLDDIQEELAAAAPSRPAPASTQQVSLDQIEAELANATVAPPQAPGAPFLAGAVPVPPPAPIAPLVPAATAEPAQGAHLPTPDPTSASVTEATPAEPSPAAPEGAAPEGAAHANGAEPSTSTEGEVEAVPAAAGEPEEKVHEGTDPAGP